MRDDTRPSDARLPELILERLVERDQLLSVAESLTGGLVAARMTRVPGASRSFRGSVTAYATDVKRDVLGVDGGLLQARGAVDADVARGMARGVRRLLGADWGVATTGVAGPQPQDGQPVGTVFVAVSAPWGAESADEIQLSGSREQIRLDATLASLRLLWKELVDD